jgi:hypothetical protein
MVLGCASQNRSVRPGTGCCHSGATTSLCAESFCAIHRIASRTANPRSFRPSSTPSKMSRRMCAINCKSFARILGLPGASRCEDSSTTLLLAYSVKSRTPENPSVGLFLRAIPVITVESVEQNLNLSVDQVGLDDKTSRAERTQTPCCSSGILSCPLRV